MKNSRGFTLIEFIIGMVFVLVIVQIGFAFLAASNGNSTISLGINGVTEVRCVEGYKFTVDQNGNMRQILDEFGKGARCR